MTEPAALSADLSLRAPARTRSLLPRFGLRSLFFVAILFCLASAVAGRNYLRLQREDGAIEALQATGAKLHFDLERREAHPATADATASLEAATWNSTSNRILRTLGLWNPPPVRSVDFVMSQPPEDKTLLALSAFPRLQRVGLAGGRLTGKSLAYLAGHDELTTLEFFVTPGIGPSDLGRMPRPERITTLRLYSTYPHRATLIGGVGALSELQELHVYLSPLSKAEVAAVASAPRLERLVFAGAVIGEPQALEPLAKCSRLKEVSLQGCMIEDLDMRAIAAIPNLTVLSLIGTPVASADPLDSLASAPNLVSLEIDGFRVDDVIAFSARRPACRIRRDGIEYLAGEELVPVGATRLEPGL